MKRQLTFIEGAGMALLISIAGSVLFSGLASLFSGGFVFRLLVSVLALSYIVYLLVRGTERTGRISVLLFWSVLMCLNLLLVDSILLYLSLHIIAIWLIRSLYYYNSLFSSLTDLLLTVFSLVAAIVAWNMSHSLLLGLWCFFLLQALFIYIPVDFARRDRNESLNTSTGDTFEHAHQSAQLALHKISTTH
jgi:hypothetical protein